MGGPWGVTQLSLDRNTVVGPIGARSLVGPIVSSWPPPSIPVPSGPPANFQTLVEEPREVLAGRWDVTPEGGCRLLFTRTLAGALDPNDLSINPDTPTWIIYSRGTSDAPAYHGPQNRGRFRSVLGSSAQCLADGEQGDSAALSRLLHGASMFFGWGLACASGVFIARYCRHRREWIEWHVKAQSVAATGTISALMLAVGMVQEQLAHWHAILGTAITIATVLQVGAGLFIHGRRVERLGAEGGGSTAEAWVAVLHKCLGRTLFVCAIVNAFEGLRMLAAGDVAEIALITFFGAVGTGFLIAEIRLRWYRRSKSHTEWKQKQLSIGLAMTAASAQASGRAKLLSAVQRARAARSFSISPLMSTSVLKARKAIQGASSSRSEEGDGAGASEGRPGFGHGTCVTVSPLRIATSGHGRHTAAKPGSSGASSPGTASIGRPDSVADVSLRELVVLLESGVTPQLRPQVEALIALRLLTARHDAILCLTPRQRHISEVTHLATALAALPNFAGSRRAIASTHAEAVRGQSMVSRIATASSSVDSTTPSLVDTWWRPDRRLLDLCASATLLRHDPDAASTAEKREGGVAIGRPRLKGFAGAGSGDAPAKDFGMEHMLQILDATRERMSDGGVGAVRAIDWSSAMPAGVPADLREALRTRVTALLQEASADQLAADSLPVVLPFVVACGSVRVRVLASEEAADAPHEDLEEATTVLSVAVQAGEKWTYMHPFPHVIESAEPGTCVLVFEPEAWLRYNSHELPPQSLASRLSSFGNVTKSVVDAAANEARHCCIVM